MNKRPSVFDLDSIIAKKQPEPAPVVVVAPSAAPLAAELPKPAAKAETPTPVAHKPPAMFRTSVYFARAVHDKLRDIAHAERKSITDLINEGLDHVLTSRNYPTTSTLISRKK